MGGSVEGQVDCALGKAGGVACWGVNSDGELGNGTRDVSAVAVPVVSLASGVTSLSVGHGIVGSTVCAVTGEGKVWCWGYAGQDGVTLGSATGMAWFTTTPVLMAGFTGTPSAVSVGADTACVLTTSGGVQCWGANFSGQLGDGTTASSEIAVQVSGLTSGVTAVSVGYGYACAVVNGGVQCWGDNGFTSSRTPTPVPGLASGVSSLSVGGSGQAACAVVNGGVQCWGDDAYGELGNEATTGSATPVAVTGLPAGVKSVSVGWNFGCALTTSGEVWCWDGPKGRPSAPHRIGAPAPQLDAGEVPEDATIDARTDAAPSDPCDPEPPYDQLGMCLSGTQIGTIQGAPFGSATPSGSIDTNSNTYTTLTANFPPMGGDWYKLWIGLYDWQGTILSGQAMSYPFLSYTAPVWPGQLKLTLTRNVPSGCSPLDGGSGASGSCAGPFLSSTSTAEIGQLDCTLHNQTRLACEILVTEWDTTGGSGPASVESRGWLHLDVTNPAANADP
jgi:hypothetical protein